MTTIVTISVTAEDIEQGRREAAVSAGNFRKPVVNAAARAITLAAQRAIPSMPGIFCNWLGDLYWTPTWSNRAMFVAPLGKEHHNLLTYPRDLSELAPCEITARVPEADNFVKEPLPYGKWHGAPDWASR